MENCAAGGIAGATAEHYSGGMNYKVVIHQDPEGGFWGEVPALPGCVSQGETLPELKANLREAIAGCLEVMAEEGRAPEPDVEIAEVAV